MEKNAAFLVVVVLLFAITTGQAAGTIYVDAVSPNDPGSGTIEDPFRKIQAGINIASPGDTVLINPGAYTGSGNYDLDPQGKSIVIRGTDPNNADVVNNTIIDPNGAGRGFYFHSSEDANCIVAGLTIKNAHTGGKGGGIFCYNSSPTITNCVITGNSAGTHGGGLFLQLSNSAITKCVINGNSAALDGGGFECWLGNPSITNCIISDNKALNGNGGGVDCFNSGNAAVTNCTLVKNTADTGGALYCLGSDAIFTNNILWANDANQGMQIGLETYNQITSSLSISHSDVQNGSESVYDPEEGLSWGGGDIDIDPCFASFDPNGDPNLWDLHLQSKDGRWNSTFYKIDFNNDGVINLFDFAGLAEVWLETGNNLLEDLDLSGLIDWSDLKLFSQYFLANSQENGWILDANTSPCIDAGDPDFNWTAEPWPSGKRINMGAYGRTTQASKSGNVADLNIDGKVNFIDLAELGMMWGVSQELIEDLDINGAVELSDFYIMAENWLWEKQ
ncbi:MAG: right-handed parallel beta-helix repeat-containing protein [Planctomycetota bacterium]